MHDWLNPKAEFASGFSRTSAQNEIVLRSFDLFVVGWLLILLVLAFPLVLIAASRSHLLRLPSKGRNGRVFNRLEWSIKAGPFSRLLKKLGAPMWPTLLNVFFGQMALVGPRVVSAFEKERSIGLVKPGIFGLHKLRCATAVNFMSEEQSDAQYLLNRGFTHDVRIFFLSVWIGIFSSSKNEKPEWTSELDICGVVVHNYDMAMALAAIEKMISKKNGAQISFVNADCVNIAQNNSAYRKCLDESTLVLPDGIGVRLASDWLNQPLRQNVNGTDLFPRLCERLSLGSLENPVRIYLLGAREDVVVRVAKTIESRWPGLEVVGAHNGYFSTVEEKAIIEDIRRLKTQLLLVALGAPLQEKFINSHRQELQSIVSLGVGGLFDFIAGRISRAPQWMRDSGLEWVWRFMQEPGRMWRRYLIGNIVFLGHVIRQKISQGTRNE